MARRSPGEQNAFKVGVELFRIWARHVGVWLSLRGCAWTVTRKYLGAESLADRMMPAVRIVELRLPGYPYPFYARWPGSDLHIRETVLVRGEYRELTKMIDPREPVTFLDIGANIGAASVFFLQTFTNATVIAVEPDAGNAALCERNLAPFGSRAIVRQAALWPRNSPLVFERETLGTGTEAGVRVLESSSESMDVQGIDVPTLLAESGVTAADRARIVLKLDAEGSEKEIFRENTEWLRHVCCIAVELHDYLPGCAECSEVFWRAVNPYVAEPKREWNDTSFVKLRGAQAADGR
jgi:FkbM family methyltransferase